MTSTKIELRDRLTMIAAQARLAATGLNENGTLGDGDLTGVVELADRIEQQLIGSPTRLTLASQMNWAARRVRANSSGCSRCSR